MLKKLQYATMCKTNKEINLKHFSGTGKQTTSISLPVSEYEGHNNKNI